MHTFRAVIYRPQKYHFRKSTFQTPTFDSQPPRKFWRGWVSKPPLSKPIVSESRLSTTVYYVFKTGGFVKGGRILSTSLSTWHLHCRRGVCMLGLSTSLSTWQVHAHSTFETGTFGVVYYENGNPTLSTKSTTFDTFGLYITGLKVGH